MAWMAKKRWLLLLAMALLNTCYLLTGMWSTPCYSVEDYNHHRKVHTKSSSIAIYKNHPYLAGHHRSTEPDSLATIFAITPTYSRDTQKVDLTSLCQTLMLVPNLHWVVVEDSPHPTALVTNLLEHCNVTSTQLFVKRSSVVKLLLWKHWKGIEQRNFALNWLRVQCDSRQGSRRVLSDHDCRGVVYYADDDNKFDLRLFEMVRTTTHVSMWPVAFSGALRHEGPLCSEGRISGWHTAYERQRPFPIDMAGFAVSLPLILRSGADFTVGRYGYMEGDFLSKLGVVPETVRCHALSEALVWHVRTGSPDLGRESQYPSDPRFIT